MSRVPRHSVRKCARLLYKCQPKSDQLFLAITDDHLQYVHTSVDKLCKKLINSSAAVLYHDLLLNTMYTSEGCITNKSLCVRMHGEVIVRPCVWQVTAGVKNMLYMHLRF